MTLTEIVAPQLGANDDLVTLRHWKMERGSRVAAGQEIAELETTKATFALEAEVDGFIYPVVEEGKEVAVRAVLAVILDQPSEDAVASFLAKHEKHPIQTGAKLGHDANNLQLTSKAREIAERMNLDVSGLPTDRVIRESDVLKLIEKQKPVKSMLGPNATRVAVYGASVGGIAVVDAIRAMGGYEVVAFLDDTPHLLGTSVFGLPVWSGEELERLATLGVGALASHIAVREFRLKMRDRAAAVGITMLNVIHPRAYLSPSVQMGVGNLIKAGAVIDTEVQIGDCCIIDNGAAVPHHNVIHDACHLAPGVAMGGGCTVGELTLLGVGSIVSSGIQVGRNVIVRPGSVLTHDIPDDVVVGGNPAKIVGARR